MPTLEELAQSRAGLDERSVDHIHRLLRSWQLIADLSFADLVLWAKILDEAGFVCLAQMRPYTAQTLRPEDTFGEVLRPEELPVIDRAFVEGKIWQSDVPLLIDGVQVRMEAIPVTVNGGPVAVMSKEGAPLTHRRPGKLESSYLECSAALTQMVADGTFPFAGDSIDPEISPRVGDGMVHFDADGRVLYISPNGVSGLRRLGAVTTVEGELLEDLPADVSCAATALVSGSPMEQEVEAGGAVVLQQALPFVSGERVTGGILLIRDVSELRHRERVIQRKDTTIREVHHRVKNNLQTVASLLRIQSRRLPPGEAQREIDEATKRIASIAIVHESLARDGREHVDFASVARQLIDMVSQGLTHPERKIELSFSGDPGWLPAEVATPLAVVLVEIIQNAVEHAFDTGSGTVSVLTSRQDETIQLSIADDGVGLRDGFGPADEGMGIQIVRALVEGELGGKVEMRSKDGTVVDLEVVLRPRQIDGASGVLEPG